MNAGEDHDKNSPEGSSRLSAQTPGGATIFILDVERYEEL